MGRSAALKRAQPWYNRESESVVQCGEEADSVATEITERPGILDLPGLYEEEDIRDGADIRALHQDEQAA